VIENMTKNNKQNILAKAKKQRSNTDETKNIKKKTKKKIKMDVVG
jgi:hypothetical protein